MLTPVAEVCQHDDEHDDDEHDDEHMMSMMYSDAYRFWRQLMNNFSKICSVRSADMMVPQSLELVEVYLTTL